jgi:hypothetical protein
MGTSEKTFQQVKAILGKLDRSIDSLRAQRTGDTVAPAREAPGRDASGSQAQPAAPFQPALIGAGPMSQTVGQPAVASQPAFANAPASINRPASPFGRATPIRPTGS